jgi:uncharacterized protein YbgA (DUF1722 family)
MKTLAMKATVRKHVNVLHSMADYSKNRLKTQERAELLGVIDAYHRGLTLLIVPPIFINHHVHDQVSLNPHPQEPMLLNHV